MHEGARAATPDDLPAVTKLAATAIDELAELRGGDVWRRREARRQPLEAELAAAVDGEDVWTTAVVGTVDDTIVGYGVLEIEELHDERRIGIIRDLYVEPLARGIGVGEAMMDLLVARARAAGAIGVDALALPGDRETKNFFETFGLTARAIVVHRAIEPLEDPEAGEEPAVPGAGG